MEQKAPVMKVGYEAEIKKQICTQHIQIQSAKQLSI